MIARPSRATARSTSGSNPKTVPSDALLPPESKPTTRPSRSTSGRPESPPTLSIVVATFIGVERSSAGFAASQLGGKAYGGEAVAPSNSPPIVVYGLTGVPFASKPATLP
jgi:hypothetical protein